MRIKLSATFEGKCMLCECSKVVFSAGDADTNKVVTICHDCCDKLGDVQTSEVIEKYGRVDEEPFKEVEMKVCGLDELQERIEKRKEEVEAEAEKSKDEEQRKEG
jgi:hypothetical protein